MHLEGADRLAKLVALVHIGQSDIKRRLHEAQRPTSKHQALKVKTAHEDVHALVFLAQDVLYTSVSNNSNVSNSSNKIIIVRK
jgi:hypothetical protein